MLATRLASVVMATPSRWRRHRRAPNVTILPAYPALRSAKIPPTGDRHPSQSVTADRAIPGKGRRAAGRPCRHTPPLVKPTTAKLHADLRRATPHAVTPPTPSWSRPVTIVAAAPIAIVNRSSAGAICPAHRLITL